MARLRVLDASGRSQKDRERFDRDCAALCRIIEKKQEQLGVKFWLPPLKQARVVLVSEEEGGEITGGLVFSQLFEMTMVGNHPSLIRNFMDEEQRIRMVLDRSGIDNMVLFLPQCLMNAKRKSGMQLIAERLKFRPIDSKFVTFEGEVYGS